MIDDQAEDPPRIDFAEGGRGLKSRHQGHVAGLEPALSEIHRKWRLRRSRHPNQHDVGFEKSFEARAIVVPNCEFNGVDTLEVFVGKTVKQTGLMPRLSVEVLCNFGDQSPEQVNGGHPTTARLANQRARHALVHQAKDHECVRTLRLVDHSADFGLVANAAKDAQLPFGVELQHHGLDGGSCSVASAVGDDDHLGVSAFKLFGRKHGASLAPRTRLPH